MDSTPSYSTGDWVVHAYYGVGQIKRIETRPIDGEDTDCFKVKTRDCTYWFPALEVDNPRIRPVGSPDIIAKMIKNLRRKSSITETDRNFWRKRINDVQEEGDLLSISVLIRDLYAQEKLRTLNQTEKNALSRFESLLLGEWASITEVDVEDIQSEFQEYIQESTAKIKVT